MSYERNGETDCVEGAATELRPVGVVRSPFSSREECPRQGDKGGADGVVHIFPEFSEALDGVEEGDEVLILTWLHLADRKVLKVHPRGDRAAPLRGVFSTRSPDRPNPVGVHRVTVRERRGLSLTVFPLEAVDGTPVLDIKSVRRDGREG
ncbi:MAG TPA: tRNA (N6-threonylcarbamoyladenosine(37)-N6)-methyltransferase TrmO [Synergistaceae bacterium]|nr:tRNA (N6-threonylcarbamoyladenosine(37)-N6)-methyltransferase TrmO [Synergistaceae bacterium]